MMLGFFIIDLLMLSCLSLGLSSLPPSPHELGSTRLLHISEPALLWLRLSLVIFGTGLDLGFLKVLIRGHLLP